MHRWRWGCTLLGFGLWAWPPIRLWPFACLCCIRAVTVTYRGCIWALLVPLGCGSCRAILAERGGRLCFAERFACVVHGMWIPPACSSCKEHAIPKATGCLIRGYVQAHAACGLAALSACSARYCWAVAWAVRQAATDLVCMASACAGHAVRGLAGQGPQSPRPTCGSARQGAE